MKKKNYVKNVSFAFSYKPGNSVFHKCPAVVKLLLLPVLSVLIFSLPVWLAATLILLLFFSELALRFSMREIFADLKIILYYAFLLVVIKLCLRQFDKETFVMLARLLCMFMLASLFFRTSSSLQLREGLEQIERAVRRVLHLKPGTTISQTLSLVLCFIPMVSKNWNQARLAWAARGGKVSLKMYVVLLPVFFSVGMKQAWNTARAMSLRTADAAIQINGESLLQN